jgi:transcriptional regulator with XRE-family HTH domain
LANERLRAAIKNAGLQLDDLADLVQVDAKTVQRWLSGRVPYSRHRTRVATALGVSERELWPEVDIPAPIAGSGRLELVGAFARASDVLAPDWKTLLRDASERIELLDFTLIEILSAPGVPDLLAAKAAAGCEVRLLISYTTRARLATDTPLDEPYEDDEPPATHEIARARGYIEPLLAIPGIEARKFATMRFNSIIRCDEQMLVTLHLWGTPGHQAPLLHLREGDHPGLFDQFETHYQSIWEHAAHPITPEPDLFPDPDTNPEHYRELVFDDPPPDEYQH